MSSEQGLTRFEMCRCGVPARLAEGGWPIRFFADHGQFFLVKSENVGLPLRYCFSCGGAMTASVSRADDEKQKAELADAWRAAQAFRTLEDVIAAWGPPIHVGRDETALQRPGVAAQYHFARFRSQFELIAVEYNDGHLEFFFQPATPSAGASQ